VGGSDPKDEKEGEEEGSNSKEERPTSLVPPPSSSSPMEEQKLGRWEARVAPEVAEGRGRERGSRARQQVRHGHGIRLGALASPEHGAAQAAAIGQAERGGRRMGVRGTGEQGGRGMGVGVRGHVLVESLS
jgi:hypothetical protein